MPIELQNINLILLEEEKKLMQFFFFISGINIIISKITVFNNWLKGEKKFKNKDTKLKKINPSKEIIDKFKKLIFSIFRNLEIILPEHK